MRIVKKPWFNISFPASYYVPFTYFVVWRVLKAANSLHGLLACRRLILSVCAGLGDSQRLGGAPLDMLRRQSGYMGIRLCSTFSTAHYC